MLTLLTAALLLLAEVHNPVIPAGYNVSWTITIVVVFAVIVAAVWFILRRVMRSRRRDHGTPGA